MWTRKFDQGRFWRLGRVEIKNVSEVFTILVEGVHGNGKYGDIAIDDFKLSHGPCPPRLLCDFENDMCDLTYSEEEEEDVAKEEKMKAFFSSRIFIEYSRKLFCHLNRTLYIKCIENRLSR